MEARQVDIILARAKTKVSIFNVVKKSDIQHLIMCQRSTQSIMKPTKLAIFNENVIQITFKEPFSTRTLKMIPNMTDLAVSPENR